MKPFSCFVPPLGCGRGRIESLGCEALRSTVTMILHVRLVLSPLLQSSTDNQKAHKISDVSIPYSAPPHPHSHWLAAQCQSKAESLQ